MSQTWQIVLAVGVLTVALRAAGPVIVGGRPLPARAQGVVELLAPAVLAALVSTQVLAAQSRLVVDERLVGLVAAALALLARAPVLVVIAAAAAATAAARALV